MSMLRILLVDDDVIVWPYYTGHGLGENTMASFAPRPFRQMFVRGCEWAATGGVERTLGFDGEAVLL